MIARLRVFSFQTLRRRVNLRLDFGGTSIFISHTRTWCCRASSSPGITFISVTSLRMVLRKRLKSICVAAFLDLYIMKWQSRFLKNVFPRSRSNARAYSRVLAPSTCGSGLPYPFPPCTFLYPVPARPLWSFQSPYGIRISDPGILAVTARSWSKNRPLTSSLRPLCGAYTDRKVTTRWSTIGFTKMILSETLCTSKPLSILPPQTLLHQQCLCRFGTSRACTWCLCPWLCGSCHHGIWSPEYSRHPFPCGEVFPIPRKLFLSESSHWVFPPWISSGACLIRHNGPILPATPDRRPSRRRYQQNLDVCWHRLTQILLLCLPWKILER